MRAQVVTTAVLSLCILLTVQTRAKSKDSADAPAITVTKLDVNDKLLKLTYDVQNKSKQDIWLCDGINLPFEDFGTAWPRTIRHFS